MKVVEALVGLFVGIVLLALAVNFYVGQAPAIHASTSTSAGSALVNGGISATSQAGTIYANGDVFWALGFLGIILGAVYLGFAYAKSHVGK